MQSDSEALTDPRFRSRLQAEAKWPRGALGASLEPRNATKAMSIGVTGPRLQAKPKAGASGLDLIEDPEQDSDHPEEQPAKATDGNEGSTSQRADAHTECRAAPAQDRNAMDHDEGTCCGDPCESR